MKRMEFKNTKVKCDEKGCGWSEETNWEKIPEWHLKPCPKCGKGQIINDSDLILHTALDAACKCANRVLSNPEKSGDTYVVIEQAIDTAKIR